MANIKSAKKRINTIDRRNAENKYVRATMRTMIKKLRALIEEGKVAEAETYSKDVYSYIDSARSKGVIHKNAAARKVGRLAAALYKAKTVVPAEVKEKPVATVEEKKEVAPVEEKKAEKKTAEKKTATKKATKKETTEKEEKPAKKTTTKKTTEKAPAEKKTTTKKTTKKAE